MTENEVIKRLNTLNDALNEQCFDADENSEALQYAIEAIEEVQEKQNPFRLKTNEK